MTIYFTEEEREYFKIEKGRLILSKDAPKELQEKFKRLQDYPKNTNVIANNNNNVRI